MDHRITMLNCEVKNGFPVESYAVSVETMGDRIRTLRMARGLTQEELGERVGVSKVAVSQWETGSTANIRLKSFLALCDELSTNPHYLLFGPSHQSASKRRATT
jgi:transcriptional regulator with XRE-family HTH domain